MRTTIMNQSKIMISLNHLNPRQKRITEEVSLYIASLQSARQPPCWSNLICKSWLPGRYLGLALEVVLVSEHQAQSADQPGCQHYQDCQDKPRGKPLLKKLRKPKQTWEEQEMALLKVALSCSKKLGEGDGGKTSAVLPHCCSPWPPRHPAHLRCPPWPPLPPSGLVLPPTSPWYVRILLSWSQVRSLSTPWEVHSCSQRRTPRPAVQNSGWRVCAGAPGLHRRLPALISA